MILKDHIKKDKKKEIEELSQKSRLLLEKGAAYQNDIGYLISNSSSTFNFSEFVGLTYHFISYLNSLNGNCFSYFFNFLILLKKKLETAEFICRFRILRTMDLNFKE